MSNDESNASHAALAALVLDYFRLLDEAEAITVGRRAPRWGCSEEYHAAEEQLRLAARGVRVEEIPGRVAVSGGKDSAVGAQSVETPAGTIAATPGWLVKMANEMPALRDFVRACHGPIGWELVLDRWAALLQEYVRGAAPPREPDREALREACELLAAWLTASVLVDDSDEIEDGLALIAVTDATVKFLKGARGAVSRELPAAR